MTPPLDRKKIGCSLRSWIFTNMATWKYI